MSCSCDDGVVADGSAVSDADCAFWRGDRPGMGEAVALARWARRARFFSEFERTMLIFSASIPRMCGIVGLMGGGVGGMSPVMLTSASTPALRSRRAACGEILNMSSPCSATVGDAVWSEPAGSCSLGSAAGTGGGGGEWTGLGSLPLPSSRPDVDGSGGCSSAMSKWLFARGVRRKERTRSGMKERKGQARTPRARSVELWSLAAGSTFGGCSWGGSGLGLHRIGQGSPRIRVSRRNSNSISWSRVSDCFF